MLKLGDNILNKIQDLILEIDHPKSPKNKGQNQNINKYVQNGSPQENKSPLGKRLYDRAKQKQKRIYQQEKQKIYAQVAETKDFKVTNKHSVFLNSKKSRKPIYQRIHEIIQEREKSVMQKRMEKRKIQQQKQRQLQQQQRRFEQLQKSKKATKQEVKRIIQQLDRKQKQRLQRINMRKIQCMRKTALQSSQKPKVTKNSQKLWQKKMMKRSLSTNIIQRFEQYGWEKKINQQKFRQQIRQKQTPFRPKITETSRFIASRASRSPISSDLNRSTSCKCFKKQQQMDKYFDPSQSQQNFIVNSNGKHSNHQKSVSTNYGNSSRILGQSSSQKKRFNVSPNRSKAQFYGMQSEYPKYTDQYD